MKTISANRQCAAQIVTALCSNLFGLNRASVMARPDGSVTYQSPMRGELVCGSWFVACHGQSDGTETFTAAVYDEDDAVLVRADLFARAV